MNCWPEHIDVNQNGQTVALKELIYSRIFSFSSQSIVWLAAPFAVLCSGLFFAGYRSLENGSFIKV